MSSTYARPNVVSYKDSSSRNFRNLSEHFGNRHDTHVPEGQRLSFFANTNTKNNKKRVSMSSQSILVFGLENNTSEKYFRDVSQTLPDDHRLFMDWFGIETFSDFMSSGLSDVVNFLRVFPQEGSDYFHYAKQSRKVSVSGYEF